MTGCPLGARSRQVAGLLEAERGVPGGVICVRDSSVADLMHSSVADQAHSSQHDLTHSSPQDRTHSLPQQDRTHSLSHWARSLLFTAFFRG